MHTLRRSAAVVVLLALALAPARAQTQQQKPALLDRWLGQLGRPFVIAIAGDSGSGKSTFARGLTRTLGAGRVKTICVDDYHSLDRKGRKRAGVTALNPKATDLGRLARDLGTLRRGGSIMKPIYDHSDGTLAGPEPFAPAPIIVVEGLHPFATRALRDKVDLAVYFDPSSRVKNAWKIKRDVGERGHSVQAVRRSIRARKPDYRAHVEPQRGRADVVVRFDWSRFDGKPSQEGLRVKMRERNLRPTRKRVRRNHSGVGFALRSERRSDGTGVTTIDGKLPATAMRRTERLLSRVTSVTPGVERRSTTLDAARVLVARRVLREIVRRRASSRKTGRGR